MIHLAVAALVGLMWSPLISRAMSPAGRLYETPWSLWLPAGSFVLASWVRGWLGLAVAYVTLRAILAGHELALWTAIYFALGVGLLVLVRSVPQEMVRWALLGSAALEIAWSFVWPGGTLAQPAFLGAAVAAVLPLAPWWGVPVLGIGIVRSQSYLAALAVVLGLLVHFPGWWRAILIGTTMIAGLYLLFLAPKALTSTRGRLDVWGAGLADMNSGAWLVGYGPGGWGTRMWRYEGVIGEVFTAAHHEPLQWLYETGLVGCLVLVAWMRQSVSILRRAEPRWRAAFASVAVLSCGFQVFHWPTVAPVMVLVLGGALHEPGGIE